LTDQAAETHRYDVHEIREPSGPAGRLRQTKRRWARLAAGRFTTVSV
jgi:hypothetical protein